MTLATALTQVMQTPAPAAPEIELFGEQGEDKHEKYIHKERFFGHCSRSFYVGDEVTEKDIQAEFKNGILKVTVPKKEEHKELPEAKHIEIQ